MSTPICQECGLCCDGTMYSSVTLQTHDDRIPLLEYGFQLVPMDSDGVGFDQPCIACRERSCMIYPQRPSICREYRCALLREVDEGRLPPAQARALIIDTIALRDRVVAQVREFTGNHAEVSVPRLLEAMVNKLDTMDASSRRQVNAGMLLATGALRVVLAKRFDPQGTLLAKQTGKTADNGNLRESNAGASGPV